MSKKGKSALTRSRRGRLVVFEGIDGSGKTTQVLLLLKYLRNPPAGGKIPFSHYSFPRYSEPWGKMIRRYLNGEFGNVNSVNPYLAAALYAGDRLMACPSINVDLKAGKIVVCDRYIGSNIAHQAAKVESPADAKTLAGKQSRKSEFIEWVEKFEYKENKIPEEDLVILLSLPPAVSRKLMSKKKKDIHEKDKDYMAQVAKVFEQLAQDRKNWVRVDCVKGGKLQKPEEIHKEVLKILRTKKKFGTR